MKKLAAWHLWLEGCALGTMLGLGSAHAAPPELVIATEQDAQAFSVGEPFVLSDTVLKVQTSVSTPREIQLDGFYAIHVAPNVKFDLTGKVSNSSVAGSVLEKSGAGTLRLAGGNTYSAPTALREGTMVVAGNSPLGNSRFTLEQSAGTVLELEAGARVGNHIELWKAWPGDIPLPGLDGVAEWRVPAGEATLSNAIAADVPVHKTGRGTLRLTDFYMGHGPEGFAELRVMEGGLALESRADTRVLLGPDTWLEGRGRVTELHVGPRATVAPGGKQETATLAVFGDAYFDADSIFHVNVAPDGRADMLTVGGKASLDGHVFAAAEDGDWARDTRYLILSAGDIGESRFAGAETDLAFLNPSLEYADHKVYLALQRNDLNPADIVDDPEEEEVGEVISPPDPKPQPKPKPRPRPKPEPGPEPNPDDTPVTDPASESPDLPEPGTEPQTKPGTGPNPGANTDNPSPNAPISLPPLQQAIEGMNVAQARTLLRQSTGSWHASVKSFLLDDGRLVRQAVLDYGRETDWHEDSAWGSDLGRRDSAKQSENANSHTGARSWARTWGSRGKRGSHGSVDPDRYSRHGLAFGLDAAASPQWRVGPVLSAQWSELKREGGQAKAKVRSLYAGAAAYGDWNGMRVTAALLRAWHRLESRRRVAVGPFKELQRASYLGRSWQAVLELTPHLRSLAQWRAGLQGAAEAGWKMGPYLRHEWSHLRMPGFQESGGVASHAVQPSRTNLHATTLGWRLRHDWRDSASWMEMDLGWRRVWGDGKVASTQSFPFGHAGLSFTSTGQPLQRHALALGMEAGLAVNRNARVSLRYSGTLGGGQSEHAAWAGLRWAF